MINENQKSEYLVFTDFLMSELECFHIEDSTFMIDTINPFCEDLGVFQRRISNEAIDESISLILFILPYSEDKISFYSDIQSLLRECKKKYPNPNLILNVNDKTKFNLLKDLNFVFECIVNEKPIKNIEELQKFIHTQFLKHSLQFRFSWHTVIELLQKRCKSSEIIDSSLQFHWGSMYKERFSIVKRGISLEFVKNYRDNCLDVIYSNELLLKLKKENLLGLYDFRLLSLIVLRLQTIRKNHKILLRNNEIVFENEIISDTNPSYSNLFCDVMSILSKYSDSFSSNKFKIQLGNGNCLIFNRRLKISLIVLKTLLTFGDPKQTIQYLVNLSSLYFKCFSIEPLCCRMQSLAPEAFVYDFDKFTHHHIEKNRSLYIKMCRLLFPYVSDIDEKFLLHSFLEVMPACLIQRFHGIKLLEFVEMIEKISEMKVPIIHLSNGKFRVGTFLNVSVYFFTTFYIKHHEMFKTDKKASVFFGSLCKHAWKEAEAGKFCNSRLRDSLSYGAPLPGHKFWLFKKRFILSYHHHKKEDIFDAINIIASFEQTEGICLALVFDTIVAVEDMETTLSEYFAGNGDYCYYNEDDLKAFFKIFENSPEKSILKSIFFEITNYGMISFVGMNKFETSIKISPSLFLKIRDTSKLLQAIITLCGVEFNLPYFVSIAMVETLNKMIPLDFVRIAKCLNPLLETLEEKHIHLPNFCWLPKWFIAFPLTVKFLQDSLELLRKENVKIKYSLKELVTDRFRLPIANLIHQSFRTADFVTISKKVEKINEELDGFCFIEANSFCVHNYNFYTKNHDKFGMNEFNFEVLQHYFNLFEEKNVKHI